jgi:magnesium-transporting ATPase (P-type)
VDPEPLPSPDGLSSAEAAARLRRHGPNALPLARPPAAWRGLLAQLTHFFAVMLWVAGALALLAGMPQLGVASFAIVVVNGVFAFVQEHRAERAAERLRDLVLLGDDLATIVAAVEQRRATFSNIRRSLTYHLTDNVAELTPSVVWALSGGRSPLALGVLQNLFLDLGTDRLPALGLGSERPVRACGSDRFGVATCSTALCSSACSSCRGRWRPSWRWPRSPR